jgi:hypothetical protein
VVLILLAQLLRGRLKRAVGTPGGAV